MSSIIINSLVPGKNIHTTAHWQIVLAVLLIPGVIVGAWLTNVIGRRYTSMLGFFGYVVFGFIIGGCYDKLKENIAGFVVLYGLMQALGHGGPGGTIGLISTEAYPTAARGMGYAVSIAFGRAGAAVGTEAFLPFGRCCGCESEFLHGRWDRYPGLYSVLVSS